MQSPLAGESFLIYFFLFLAAMLQEREAASAPAALPDLREGLDLVSILVAVFSLVCAAAGFTVQCVQNDPDSGTLIM